MGKLSYPGQLVNEIKQNIFVLNGIFVKIVRGCGFYFYIKLRLNFGIKVI